MSNLSRRVLVIAPLALVAACGAPERPPERIAASGPAELNGLIARYADLYEVPEDLVHRVVIRESRYNPAARNGPYYGLMQIHPQTARTMGHRGPPEELLDAETNLRYAVKYLRGAWLVARGDRDRAVMWYARGYYYEAKRLGLLEETGLRG
jgi:soluble lytic murein transglycosylase-like protein